jgi:hypothetical protein
MKVDRSILEVNDQSMGMVADPDKLESSINHLANIIDSNDDEKTTKTGNHEGTWRGMEPEQVAEGINALRINALETEVGKKANKLQESWNQPVYQNGWLTFDTSIGPPAQYMIDSLGFVHIEGIVKGGTDVKIFTLPIGYRPTKTLYFPGIMNKAEVTSSIVIQIKPTGVVEIYGYGVTWASLCGITYKI